MAKLRVWVDPDGELKKLFEEVIAKEEDLLHLLQSDARILYTYRNNAMHDDEGEPIAAYAKSLGNRERDLYGFDFEINVFEEYWTELSSDQQYRLAHHELMHCKVEMEDGEPVTDDYNRLSIWIEPHDVVIKTFSKEIEIYGLGHDDMKVAKFLFDQMIKTKEGLKYVASKIKKSKGE